MKGRTASNGRRILRTAWFLKVCLVILLVCSCIQFVIADSTALEQKNRQPALQNAKASSPSSLDPPKPKEPIDANLQRYRRVLATLKNLSRRRAALPSKESEDLLNTLVRLVVRNLFPKSLSKKLETNRPSPGDDDTGSSNDDITPDGDAPPSAAGIPVIEDTDTPAVKRSKALKILTSLAYDHEFPDAYITLGDIHLYGTYGYHRDAHKAYQYPRDHAKALLYLSFAAVGRDTIAEHVLGYWHYAGIATEKSCEHALYFYRRVAEKAVEKFKEGPPGGLTMLPVKLRLTDAEGGVYGHGASAVGDHGGRATGEAGQGALTTEDILQYWRIQADSGNAQAQVLVGQLYYMGSNHVRRNFRKAMHYFRAAAATHPGPKAVSAKDAPHTVKQAANVASQAICYIGTMFWRGEGVQQDNTTARDWFERGAADQNPMCLNGLGVMYMKAIGGRKDTSAGLKLVTQAAHLGSPDAQALLGELHLQRGASDYAQALKWFLDAANRGNIVAMYHLGEMYRLGRGVAVNCHFAVGYFKHAAEKGNWNDPIVQDAQVAYAQGDMEGAAVRFMMAAERGFEVAQTNAAWIIDRGLVSFNGSKVFDDNEDPYGVALYLWNRAANQGNIDARVKMGDYYYYGLGTRAVPDGDDQDTSDNTPGKTPLTLSARLLNHKSGAHRDVKKAAIYYQVAAEMEYSSVAMFNLGWMYETGTGVDRDYHLAKRWYDSALAQNPEAYLPVQLALCQLRLKMLWEWVMNLLFGTGQTAKVHHQDEEAAEMKENVIKEMLPHAQPHHQPHAHPDGHADAHVHEEEGDYELWDYGDDEHLFWDMYDEGATGGDTFEMTLIVLLASLLVVLLQWRRDVVRRGEEDLRRRRLENANTNFNANLNGNMNAPPAVDDMNGFGEHVPPPPPPPSVTRVEGEAQSHNERIQEEPQRGLPEAPTTNS
ncbi:hypothetical protein BC832DRAFT_569449 [Gaertneriomyces semiglobifer]|nr:hypothetical protein BC832DRAFT_569449 [Gaertneriomyces semiglobifer]